MNKLQRELEKVTPDGIRQRQLSMLLKSAEIHQRNATRAHRDDCECVPFTDGSSDQNIPQWPAWEQCVPCTPAFSVTCIGEIFVHLSTCHLSTCYLNGCLTVKQAIFHIISGRNDKEMMITDLTWLKKFVNIAGFQIYKIIERFAWCRLALNGDFRYNLGLHALDTRKM